MFKVIKSQKRRRLLTILFEIIIGIGLYAFIFYSEYILGTEFKYVEEIFLGYIVFLFFVETISMIAVFNTFDIQVRKNHQNINFLLGADIAEGYRYSQLGMLHYDQDQTIIWTSELFEERHIHILGQNLLDWHPSIIELLNSNDEKKEIIITIQQRKYSAICLKELHIILLKDVSDMQNLIKTREEQAPVMATIVMDNFAELNSISNDSIIGEIETETRKLITEWAKKYEIVLRRLKEDSYIAVFSEEIFEKIKEDSFSILNSVKSFKTSIDFHITLSIGIGRGTYDFKTLSELSNSAIDVALSRGGDQVVITNYGKNLEYFGGTTSSRSKRNLVKSRMLSQSFFTYVKASETILIMGHKNLDMDALGACLGMYYLCKKYIKDVYIIWDEKLVEKKAKNAMTSVYSRMELQDMVISQAQANLKAGKKTLLVLVDHHSQKLSLYPDIIDKSTSIAVIDHHRKNEDAITSPGYSFHDPSASSTCEIITEIIKYAEERNVIDVKVATVMLSGILLDTNYFRRQTGIRTFEACAILKELGAVTEDADNLLKDEYEEYLLKTKIMNNVEIPYYGILVAMTNKDDIVEREVLSKVADESLTLKEIRAVFVIGRISINEVGISARSNGSVNVQLIMEKLGGGGHFTSAATSKVDITLQDMRKNLDRVLALYLNDATVNRGE